MLPQLRTTCSTVYCSCSAMLCVWAFSDVRKSPESWQYRGSRKIGFGWATAVTRKSRLLIRQISHTHNYLQWLSCFSSVSLRKTRIVSAVQRPCRHYWGLESLPIFGSLFTSLTWMYWHLVLKGAAAKERNLDQRGSRGEECRHVRDSLYHMSMRANSTLRTQSGRTCTGTHLIE